MKRKSLLAWTVAACCAAAAHAEPALMSVQIKSAELREKPSPFGAIAATLAYGDRVLVLEQSGPWLQVKKAVNGEASGWIHSSALIDKPIALKAGADTATRASSDEVAIAGKGFNKQVESEYKAANAKLDFAAIDRMEKIKIPQKEIREFVEKGNLGGNGGAK